MKCMFCFKMSDNADEFAAPTICKSCQTSMSLGKPIDTTAHAHDAQVEESRLETVADEEVEDYGNPSGIDWYIEAMRQYAVFTGRARRKEYWWFFLFNCIFMGLLSGLAIFVRDLHWLTSIYWLAMFLPQLAVSIRRLHDIGISGWWLALGPVWFCLVIGVIVALHVPLGSTKMVWLGLIGYAPGLAMLIAAARDGEPSANRYGPSPKYLPEES